MNLYEEYKWDGVVVVGGGCTGILAALEIAKHNIPVLIIEPRYLSGGQTAHSHGWLHRGYIFPDIRKDEFEILRRGANWWEEMLEELEIAPLSKEAVIGFSNLNEAQKQIDKWKDLGMSYERTDPLNDTFKYSYKTPEWSVSPTRALKSIYNNKNIKIMSAKVIDLNKEGGISDKASLVIETPEEKLILHAGSIILAAGNGIEDIIKKHPEDCSLQSRKTYMLVIRSDAGLPDAFALPEKKYRGIFSVKRYSNAFPHYLISNFMSYSYQNKEELVKDMWLKSILKTIRDFLPELINDSNCTIGYYPADKTELSKDVALGLPVGLARKYLASNTILAVPGKFTISPLIAHDAAKNAIKSIQPIKSGKDLQTSTNTHWSYEDWEMIYMTETNSIFKK